MIDLIEFIYECETAVYCPMCLYFVFCATFTGNTFTYKDVYSMFTINYAEGEI